MSTSSSPSQSAAAAPMPYTEKSSPASAVTSANDSLPSLRNSSLVGEEPAAGARSSQRVLLTSRMSSSPSPS